MSLQLLHQSTHLPDAVHQLYVGVVPLPVVQRSVGAKLYALPLPRLVTLCCGLHCANSTRVQSTVQEG
jgi:hypothetical protein